MESNTYADLPAPLCPNEDTGDILYTMGLSVLPLPAGKVTIIKTCKFEKQLSIDLIERKFARGVLYQLSWAKDRYVTIRGFQTMLRKLCGDHYVYTLLTTDPPPVDDSSKAMGGRALLTREQLELGFKFIKDDAPRTNGEECEQIMWKEFQFNDPASPIFDFREKVVQQILDQLRAGSNLVTKEIYYPLAWGDINPRMQAEKSTMHSNMLHP